MEIEKYFLKAVKIEPTPSIRSIAAKVEVAHSKVWKTLRLEQFHNYDYQALQSEDSPRRVDFFQLPLHE